MCFSYYMTISIGIGTSCETRQDSFAFSPANACIWEILNALSSLDLFRPNMQVHWILMQSNLHLKSTAVIADLVQNIGPDDDLELVSTNQ